MQTKDRWRVIPNCSMHGVTAAAHGSNAGVDAVERPLPVEDAPVGGE
jgi:hypothetical protein